MDRRYSRARLLRGASPAVAKGGGLLLAACGAGGTGADTMRTTPLRSREGRSYFYHRLEGTAKREEHGKCYASGRITLEGTQALRRCASRCNQRDQRLIEHPAGGGTVTVPPCPLDSPHALRIEGELFYLGGIQVGDPAGHRVQHVGMDISVVAHGRKDQRRHVESRRVTARTFDGRR